MALTTGDFYSCKSTFVPLASGVIMISSKESGSAAFGISRNPYRFLLGSN